MRVASFEDTGNQDGLDSLLSLISKYTLKKNERMHDCSDKLLRKTTDVVIRETTSFILNHVVPRLNKKFGPSHG